MAMSQTMSNPSNWIFQPYQNEFSNIINHTDTSPTNPFAAAAARNSVLSPEQGRVAKPTRRRPKASQRNPTILLNTDTTNFRAMVQHFTGGPAARQQISSRAAAIGYMEHVAAAAAPAEGFCVQYPNQELQLQQSHHTFMMGNVHGGVGGGGGGVPPQAAPGGGNGISYDRWEKLGDGW